MVAAQPSQYQATENTFTSWDGASIFYRAWLPEGPCEKSIFLFHRGHEHSGRWQATVEALALEDVAIFAWDQRGHGRSDGERGRAPNLLAVLKDADWFARHLIEKHGINLERTAVIASSVGAVVAAAWVHDFAPPICGLVLAAPALRVKLYVPLAIPFLRLKEKCFPGGTVTSYVKSRMLTHDAEQAASYDADPLIFRQIAVNVLLDLHDTGTRLLSDAGAIQTPTLLLSADRDWVVELSAQREFFQRLGSAIKQMEVFPGSFHSLFHETARAQVVEQTRTFLAACFSRPSDGDNLLEADKGSFTRTEYDLLRAPGAMHWPAARAAMKVYGRLSTGMRLGMESGYDSGLTLDYVYKNQPDGITPLGKLIDYFYLNAIGWRGIRVRRQNLERLLDAAIHQLHDAGKVVQILDIASGPGRYVLEDDAPAVGYSHLRRPARLSASQPRRRP